MDLNKDISFGNKKDTYPTKTSINLADQNPAGTDKLTAIALFIILFALVGLFVKFAVFDPLTSVMASSDELSQAQAELESLEAANADYTTLNEQYSRYIVTGLTEDEQNLADRNEVLDLLRTEIMGSVNLSSAELVENTLTVTCVGVGLQGVSGLVGRLESDSRVLHVTVSAAQSEADQESSSATIAIILRGALDTTDTATSTATTVLLDNGAGNGE